jgi:Short C-terminal domain
MNGLAQANDLGPAMLMLGGLLGIVLAAGAVLIWVRSRTLGGGSVRSGSGLFDDLRRMRESGEITEEEFAAAKRSVVDRMAGRSPADGEPAGAISDSATLEPDGPTEAGGERSDSSV